MKDGVIRVSVSLNPELVKRVEEYASSLNINRSGAISVLLSQAFEYKAAVEMAGVLPALVTKVEEMQKIEAAKLEVAGG